MSQVRTGILVILDGFGVNPDPAHNAVAQAKTPHLDRLLRECPHTVLDASESHVGLPAGFMGNSEVGHLNIGAGRVVYQDFSLISKAIEDETFYENPVLAKLMSELTEVPRGGTLHLLGLVSDGGVHSHISHLFALLRMAKRRGVREVFIHAVTDGRDTAPSSAIDFIKSAEAYCRDLGIGKIATVSGRFFAMDRDQRWDRTERAYLALVCAEAEQRFVSAEDYIRESYSRNTTDEFLLPAVHRNYKGINDGDGVIFFNFRADRARQMSRAMTQPEFSNFPRPKFPTLLGFVCLTPYDTTLKLPCAYEKSPVPMTLGAVVSAAGGKQLRIAETEKYAHVTYFFNGGEESSFPGEKRVLIPSPRNVKTYDLKPEMAAREVCQTLIEELGRDAYQLAVVNFANCDMVGHTGNLRAAITAVEVVDECVGKILAWAAAHQAFVVLTADHGNCEKMLDDSGLPLTAHTLLQVPLIIYDPLRQLGSLRSGGKLSDIAPTLLAMWGIAAPSEMTGLNLLENAAQR